jgi:hypothetical protein
VQFNFASGQAMFFAYGAAIAPIAAAPLFWSHSRRFIMCPSPAGILLQLDSNG